ncbi:MAG: hypothetical protein ACRD5L_01950, partial [Bryobacteraceae bacterium]
MDAMGGEAALHAIHTISFKGVGSQNALEQSERPEGPWITNYDQGTQAYDFENGATRAENSTRGFFQLNWWDTEAWTNPSVVRTADGVSAFESRGHTAPYLATAVTEAQEALFLNPLRILLHAAVAPDVHAQPDVQLHGFAQHVIAFTWDGNPVRIFLSSYSNTITAVEITRALPSNLYFGPWGDVTTRTYFGAWNLETGGIHYPRLWYSEVNGQALGYHTITQFRINPELPADSFLIPDDVKQAFRAQGNSAIDETPFGNPKAPPKERAPGIVQVPGSWAVGEVRQDDG